MDKSAKKVLRKILKKYCEDVDEIIAPSEDTKLRLQKMNINKMINVDDALLGDIKSILAKLTAKIQKKEKSQWNSQIEEWKKIVPPSYNKKQDL